MSRLEEALATASENLELRKAILEKLAEAEKGAGGIQQSFAMRSGGPLLKPS